MQKTILVLAATLGLLLVGSAVQAAEIFDVTQGTNPSIGSDSSGNLSVVFEGFAKGSDVRDILYCRSVDKGRTWTPPVNVSRTPGVSTVPSVTVERSGAIDVVWRDTTSGELSPDIYFARSTDGGRAWTKALDISNTPGICTSPAIACGPDESLHVVWIDTSVPNGRPDVFYTCSTDGGKDWSHYEDISPTPGISSEPVIAVGDDQVIHSAWADTSSGEEHPDIYYVRKIGAAWSTPVDISNSPRVSAHPGMSCGPKGRVYLCWTDNSQKQNAADIWCVIGRNGKFAKPINISDTPGVSSEPRIVTDNSGRLVIIWSDTSLRAGKPDIYARASNDNGDDFSNILETKTLGIATKSTATFVGTRVVIAWEEAVASTLSLKTTSLELKGIATGPVDQVIPTVHRVNR
jgi:hypothetical protein